MLDYYEKRAPEYERIYAKPERQADLRWLEAALARLTGGRRVLELACGTGYWTRRIARVATSVVATDGSAQLAASAVASCDAGAVTSAVADAYALEAWPDVDCVLAGFFFSHVPVARRGEFVAGVGAAVAPGTRLVLFDNRYVEGGSTPIARRDGDGDTYQIRKLDDGSTHEVLKNFPEPAELDALLADGWDEVAVETSRYFWLASANLAGPRR